MAKRLFVGNLPYTITEDALRDLFSQAGEVDKVMVITDRMTGRAKGFAFIEMKTDEDSNKATEQFNGYTLEERKIVVNEARPREDRGVGRGGYRSNRGYGGGR